MNTEKWLQDKKKLVQIVEDFLTKTISANKFQSSYLEAMQKAHEISPKEVFDILQDIFYDADEYSVLGLEGPHLINEEELRKRTYINYLKLQEVLKPYL